MSLIEKMERFYTAPFREALNVNDTCLGSIKARFLFVAQLIMAIVAIPFIVILGALAARCSSDEESMSNHWCESVKRLFVVIIPGSFLGIFLPLSTSFKCIDSFDSCQCPCTETRHLYNLRSTTAERHYVEIESDYSPVHRDPYLVD